jgi:antitoxin FitA
MDEIVLRDLDQEVVAKLAERAADNNRPLEQEIALVLRQSVQGPDRRRDAETMVAMARRIAAMTPSGVPQTDSVDLIREERDR